MLTEKILIVEDEILIADNLSRYLSKKGHNVIGIAISYEEAVELYNTHKPDVALLDIRLNGERSGIDFAHYIKSQPNPCPFIFLTSQIDAENIEKAKKTFPAGYLSKPIQKESLYTTIEIAMHKQRAVNEEIKSIPLYDGTQHHKVVINEILYLRAEHVYVQVYIDGEKNVVQRSPLKVLSDQLPPKQFVQTHRSYVVNLDRVTGWDAEQLFIGNHKIPLSRSRKKDILDLLKK